MIAIAEGYATAATVAKYGNVPAIFALRVIFGMNLAVELKPMDKYLRVHTPMSGFVRIELATGNLDWECVDLDPVAMKYAEKYLVIEGFVEQAIGALDPTPDSDVKAMLDSILFS